MFSVRCKESTENLRREKKVIVLFSGAATPNRIVHIRKIGNILGSLFEKILVILKTPEENILNTADRKVKVYKVNVPPVLKTGVFPIKIINSLKWDLINGIFLHKLARRDDIVLFLGIYQPISLLFVKLARAKAMLFCGGLDIGSFRERKRLSTNVFFMARWAIQMSMIKFSDKMVIESSGLMKFYGLKKYKNRILDGGHLFVDINRFRVVKTVNLRSTIVAYIGALSPEKGAISFVRAALVLLKNRQDVKFLLIGDGLLRDRIEELIELYQLEDYIKVEGWVKHSEMPQYLNLAKLVVMPSCSEGLPNLLIEAMACGTPVLATPVGAIPNIIKEGKTGFLLKSNNPKHIAGKVVDLLSRPDLLENVSTNARKWVLENFSYEKTLESWREIFQDPAIL